MIKYVIAAALAAARVAAQARDFAMKNENGAGWICAGSKTPILSVCHDARRGATVQVRARANGLRA